MKKVNENYKVITLGFSLEPVETSFTNPFDICLEVLFFVAMMICVNDGYA